MRLSDLTYFDDQSEYMDISVLIHKSCILTSEKQQQQHFSGTPGNVGNFAVVKEYCFLRTKCVFTCISTFTR